MTYNKKKGGKSKFKDNLTKVIIITLSWTLIWTLLFLNDYATILTLMPEEQADEVFNFIYYMMGNISGGLLAGLLGGSLLVFKLNTGYREKTFLYGIINSTIVFVILYILLAVIISIIFTILNKIIENDPWTFSNTMPSILGMFTNLAFYTGMIVWAFIVSGTQFMLQVSEKFGNGVLWRFITGKYYHPKEEKRIFMFLDIKSSTSIAEKIGHMNYFELLRQFYRDITDPIICCGGEIYQYVGDEVIITWTDQSGITENNCVRCFFLIQDTIQNKKPEYLDKYGFLPEFKAGIHVGEATIGEIGIIKKDIVYSGDVLNTTARIQGECNTYGVDILISAELLNILKNVESDYEIEAKGVFPLKGKENVVGLISIKQIGH